MPRPIEALIHTDALAHNLARARRPRPMPGSGRWSRPTPTATASSASSTGCAAPTALRCSTWPRPNACARSAGAGPILLLEGCFEPRDLELCSRLNLWHVVHCAAQIDWLAAHKTHQPHRVFLKMNSGMNRLGFTPRPSARPGRG